MEVLEGLMFYNRCLFFKFRHRISKLPQPITVNICHMISIWLNFLMQSKNLGLSSKNFGKNIKNLGRFYTNSDFACKYL